MIAFALLVAACGTTRDAQISATTGDPVYDSTDKVRFEIEQTAHPMTFSGDKGKVDVSFRITLTNRFPTPITVKRLTLQSMGGGVFRLETTSRKFDTTIAPGAKESFKFWASAIATDQITGTRAALIVRSTVDALQGDTRIHEVFNRRVNDQFGIAIGSN